MKIQKIRFAHPEVLTPKKNLSQEEWQTLKHMLRILIQTHHFFEYGETPDIESIHSFLLPVVRPEFEGIVIHAPVGIPLYDLGDYLLHSAYFTKDGYLLLTAYLKLPYSGSAFCAYPENLRYFLIAGEDTGFTTESLYDCFFIDVPIPEVDLENEILKQED